MPKHKSANLLLLKLLHAEIILVWLPTACGRTSPRCELTILSTLFWSVVVVHSSFSGNVFTECIVYLPPLGLYPLELRICS